MTNYPTTIPCPAIQNIVISIARCTDEELVGLLDVIWIEHRGRQELSEAIRTMKAEKGQSHQCQMPSSAGDVTGPSAAPRSPSVAKRAPIDYRQQIGVAHSLAAQQR